MLKLSIIVPIYNAEKYIDSCMASIFAQTIDSYEVILVDDGSTDKSAEICDKYKDDLRVTVIHKENEGAGPTRNAGLAIAKGEYVAFPDADDYFSTDMFEKLYNKAKETDADIVYSGINHIYTDDEGNEYLHHTSVCQEVIFRDRDECRKGVMTFFPTTTVFDVPWNKIYKRSVITENNISFRPLRRCQDAVFNLEFYNCVNKVTSTKEIFYSYRENNQQRVWQKFPKDYYKIIIYYSRTLEEILTEWGIFKENIKEHYDTSFVYGIFSAFDMCFNPKFKMKSAEKREFIKSILQDEYVKSRLSRVAVSEDAKVRLALLREGEYKILRALNKERFINSLKQNKFIRKLFGK